MLVEDELDRVMPSRRVVMAAGRYDLHHAIQYHGGYTQVTHPAPTVCSLFRVQGLHSIRMILPQCPVP